MLKTESAPGSLPANFRRPERIRQSGNAGSEEPEEGSCRGRGWWGGGRGWWEEGERHTLTRVSAPAVTAVTRHAPPLMVGGGGAPSGGGREGDGER